MRSARVVSEETIDAYIRYLEAVAYKLGLSVEELAESEMRLNETVVQIERVKEWSGKTKSNYRTAVNRLYAYLKSKQGEQSISSACDCMSNAKTLKLSDDVKELKMQIKDKYDICAQINEIEKMTREDENKTWASVFVFISGYALAMPPIVANIGKEGLGLIGALLVSLASIFAFAGVILFIPVLRRSSRQLRKIQSYGENLIFSGRQSGYIHPVDWTFKEKLFGFLSAFALIVSIVFLCFSKVV
jgi:hypothetical protein